MKETFDIFLKDDVPLTGAQWPSVLSSAKPPFVEIFISFKAARDSDESEISGDDDLGSIDLDPPAREQKRPAEEGDVHIRYMPTTRTLSGEQPVYHDTGLGSAAVYESPQSTMSYTHDEKDTYDEVNTPDGMASTQAGQQVDTGRHSSQSGVRADSRQSEEVKTPDIKERRTRPVIATMRRAHDSSNVTFLI